MMRTSAIAIALVAGGLVAACGTGPRLDPSQFPAGTPRNAQEMVTTWDAQKTAEQRCSYEQAGQQIGVDGKKAEKVVTPACGDYKK